MSLSPFQLELLGKQLFNRIPLVGNWLSRRAAERLAEDASHQAIELLARALDAAPNPEARQIARAALEAAQGPAAINAICHAWVEMRQQLSQSAAGLGDLIAARGWVASSPAQARVLTALKSQRLDIIENGGADIVAPLWQACADADPTLAGRARACLSRLRSQPAIDQVCADWLQMRQQKSAHWKWLEEAIIAGRYVAEKPPEGRVYSGLVTGQLEKLAGGSQALVPPLLQALQDPDPPMAERAGLAISALKNPGAQEAACQAALQNDLPALVQAVVRGGFAPRAETPRALFFFLTEQWERYESLDFDHRLLQALYETAEPALRERIMTRLRQAGRVEYLSILGGRAETAQLGKLGASEYGLLVQLLGEQGQWIRLWELALRLPLGWSVQAVRRLSAAGWQPEDPAEAPLFQQLAALGQAKVFSDAQFPLRTLPLPIERSRVRLVHGRLNDIAFAPRQMLLALVTSRRRLVVWDFHSGAVKEVLKATSSGEPFAHSLGEVAYTPQGALLFAERTRGAEPCRVYARQDGIVQAIFTETGSITALEPAAGEQVLWSGRSGFVTLFDMQGSPQQVKRQLFEDFWVRAIGAHPQQAQAILLHRGACLVTLPDLAPIVRFSGWKQVACSAAFLDAETLAIGRTDGVVQCMHRKPRSFRVDGHPLVQHTGSVTALAFLKRHNLLLSAGAEGVMRFTRWPAEAKRSAASLGSVGKMGETIGAVHISQDEEFMAVSHSETSLSLWDLRPLDAQRLLNLPLSEATPADLAAVSMLANDAAIEGPLRQAMQAMSAVLKHRFRYEIELESPAGIKPGEFDIEIE